MPLATDALLRAHAAKCPECASLLEAHLRWAAGLERFDVPPLDPGFSRRVVRQATGRHRLALNRPQTGRYQPLLLAAAGLIAAAVLVAILPWQGRGGRPGEPAAVVLLDSPGSPEREIRPEPTPAYTPAQAGSLVARELSDDDWLLLWERISDQLAAERLASLGPLAEGIRPIAASLSSVLDELRRTFPLTPEPSLPASSEDSAERRPGSQPTV